MNAADALTDLVVETFRLNGRLLAAGDALVADVGLTSARWQILGAIALSAPALSIAQIARNMGLSRQAVRRLANEMERDGFVRFEANPHHQRSHLVVLTRQGKQAFDSAMKRQKPWAGRLATGLSAEEIAAAAAVLRALRTRLEGDGKRGDKDA